MTDPTTTNRLIMFNADTGEQIGRAGVTGKVAAIICADLLPGATPELVDEWYSVWMEADANPQPFPEGSRVTLPSGIGIGRVVKRVETDGELHTLAILWAGNASPVLYGPAELIALSA